MRNKGCLLLILLYLVILLSACAGANDLVEPTDSSMLSTEDDDIILFKDKTIEMMAKEMLKYDKGGEYYHLEYEDFSVTKSFALTVTGLGWEPSEFGFFKCLRGNIESLEDLVWFPNITRMFLEDCNLSDLRGIEVLENLEVLSLRKNNIADLSPIRNMSSLRELNISENSVNDLTPLAELNNLTDLSASYNHITDISVLYGLEKLKAIDLDENLIKDEDLKCFSDDRENEYFAYELIENIHPDMPKFCFELSGYREYTDWWWQSFEAERLKIYNNENKEKIYDVYLPDYTFWGGRTKSATLMEGYGLKLIDANFDGYLDIELYDAHNGRMTEKLFITWNPDLQKFEMNEQLISLHGPYIDVEKQEIYGGHAGSLNDGSVTETAYKFINDELTEVRQEYTEIVEIDYEMLCGIISDAKKYSSADITLYHTIIADSRDGSEIENNYTLDKYNSEEDPDWERIIEIDFSSEQGQRLSEAVK